VKLVVPLPALLLSAGVTVMATPLLGLTVVTVNTLVDGGGTVVVELPPPQAAINKVNPLEIISATQFLAFMSLPLLLLKAFWSSWSAAER
jgi:hypothetical protein